jgi:alpha-ketoglutarate-dependent taurine dioxygenase
MLSALQTATLRNEGFVSVDLAIDEKAIIALAKSLGQPVSSHSGNRLVNGLSPAKNVSTEVVTFSSKFGLGRFPFHTDTAHWPLPARFLILQSVGTSQERPTLLIKAQTLLDTVRTGTWTRAVWKATGPRGAFLCTFRSRVDHEQIFRFDPLCMKPMNSAATKFAEEVKRVTNSVTIDWVRGKAVVIDNWQVLHARADAPNDDSRTRCLNRVLVFDRKQLPLFCNALAT